MPSMFTHLPKSTAFVERRFKRPSPRWSQYVLDYLETTGTSKLDAFKDVLSDTLLHQPWVYHKRVREYLAGDLQCLRCLGQWPGAY